jgi:hypothetical protein
MSRFEEATVRSELVDNNIPAALKLLDGAFKSAKRRKSVEDLRAIGALVEEVRQRAEGRRYAETARRLLYAVNQNIVLAERGFDSTSSAPSGSPAASSAAGHSELKVDRDVRDTPTADHKTILEEGQGADAVAGASRAVESVQQAEAEPLTKSDLLPPQAEKNAWRPPAAVAHEVEPRRETASLLPAILFFTASVTALLIVLAR